MDKEKKELKRIVRLKGVDLDGTQPVERALWKIKGIGHVFARAIRIKAGINPKMLLGNLTEEQINKIDDVITHPQKYNIPSFLFNRRKDYDSGEDKHLTQTDLELTNKEDIARHRQIKSYRGVRHAAGKKVRGQRTKSTGRRGATVGVVKKKQQPQKKK